MAKTKLKNRLPAAVLPPTELPASAPDPVAVIKDGLATLGIDIRNHCNGLLGVVKHYMEMNFPKLTDRVQALATAVTEHGTAVSKAIADVAVSESKMADELAGITAQMEHLDAGAKANTDLLTANLARLTDKIEELAAQSRLNTEALLQLRAPVVPIVLTATRELGRCAADRPIADNIVKLCVLKVGHPGPHRDDSNVRWWHPNRRDGQ